MTPRPETLTADVYRFEPRYGKVLRATGGRPAFFMTETGLRDAIGPGVYEVHGRAADGRITERRAITVEEEPTR